MKIHHAVMVMFVMITVIIAGGFVVFVNAAPNLQINYQGKLTNTSDVAVANGSYNLRFKLCTGATCAAGGDPIWTETFCKSSATSCDGLGTDERVSVTNGLFSAMLGSITALSSIDFNQTLYLEVNVGGSATTPSWETLTPRKILGTVPASFESVKLGGATWAAPGAIGGTTAAAGTFSTFGWKAGTANVVTLTHSASTTRTITFPDATDTVVLLAQSQALTSKTYNGLTLTSAADGFTIAGGSTSRTLTVTGADKSLQGTGTTISLGGTLTTENALTTAGNYALTITSTGTTNATVPAGTVTLVDLASSQALTSKTISGLTVSTTTGTLTIPAATIAFSGAYATTLTTTGTTTVTLPTSGTLAILGANTFTSNQTIQKADPSLILDVTTATDTDFWLGVQDDAGSDDDDTFQIGDGTTPGTNPFLTINTSGSVGIGTTSPGTLLHIEKSAIDNSIQDQLRLQSHTNAGAYGSAIQFRNRWDSGSYWTTARIAAIEESGYGGMLIFSTNNGAGSADDTTVNAMAIDEDGYIGIGTTSQLTGFVVNIGSALIQTSHDAIATTTTWNNLGSASEGLFLSYDATNNRGRIVSIETATAYRELVIAGSNMYFNTGTAGQTNALTIDSSQATTFTGVMTLSGGGGTASAAVPTIVLSGGEKTIDFGGNGQQLIGGNSAGQLFMARNVWWDAGNNVYRASRNDIGASVLIIGTDKQLYFQNAANATSVGDIVTPTTRFSVTDTDLTVNTGQITLSADTNFVLSGGTNGASFDTDVLSIDATNNRVGVGTTTPGVLLDVSQNQNGETYLRSINTTAGTSSTARIQAQSDGGSMYMRMHSSTFTTSNQYQANTGLLESNIGALVLSAAGALSIQFWTNSTQRLNINSSGYLGVSTTDFQDHAGTGDRNSQMVVTINDASTAWGDAIGALTLRNTNQTNNHWVKLNFAANDNNTVVGAAISAQTTDYTVTAWSTTDLVVHTGLKGAAPLERMRITGAGNVTMGSNITNGTTTMDIGGTTTTIALCHANADADDEQIVDCSGAPSDIAEWYDTRIGVEDGDVLIPTGEYREYEAEGSDYNGRIKSLGKQRISVLGVSQTAYQSNVVGVVSSGPWQIIGEDIKKVATNAKPVALAGRVPIKVTLENGAIAPGDLLVSSSTPGYAMKYDPAKVPQGTGSFAIIGTALESFAGEKGKVMAIIKSGYLSKERTLTIADKGGALIELHDTISVVNDRLRQLESQFATLVQRGVMNIGAIDSTGAFVSLKVIGDADIGGTLVIGKAVAQKYSCQDCAILRPGLLVYITKDKEVALASSAREKTVPAIGVVMGVEENQVIVAIGGSVDMFEGLIAGTRYYLAQEQGKITAKPTAVIRQIIGIAQSSTELLIQPNFEYRIEKQQPEKESVVMLK